jgi:hypothetical protein
MTPWTPSPDLPLWSASAQRAPSVAGSPTSAAAADAMEPDTLNALQRRVYEFVSSRPSTDEEIADRLEMNPSTVRPRRVELVRRGLIAADGTRATRSGRQAAVWRKV